MKGICFKEPLFHATIEGRKTQTRRIMNPQPEEFVAGDPCVWVDESGGEYTFEDGGYWKDVTPRYKVGEIIYLKEPYATSHGRDCEGVIYRFDDQPGSTDFWDKDTRWENKLFMPESAARFFIRVTAVRAERLQEISDEDCFKEGICRIEIAGCGIAYAHKVGNDGSMFNTPREAYAALIDKINGKGTWDSNPWVWVHDYELCESVKPKE